MGAGWRRTLHMHGLPVVVLILTLIVPIWNVQAVWIVLRIGLL
jgi:hypothetical protein